MYSLDEIQTNMAWQNAAMMDFFEHLSYTPRRPFIPTPIWPHASQPRQAIGVGRHGSIGMIASPALVDDLFFQFGY